MKTLLVGMGNPILMDDSVGVRLAGDVADRLAGEEVTRAAGAAKLDVVRECSVGGLELIHVLTGYERVIIIDSIRTVGGTPGDWYRFTAAALRETMNLSNVHDANFATALELGRRMGARIPPDGEIHLLAVEVEENATFGETLSENLAAAYPRILEEIASEIRAILADAP
jgi:hydrogenase maturation protease